MQKPKPYWDFEGTRELTNVYDHYTVYITHSTMPKPKPVQSFERAKLEGRNPLLRARYVKWPHEEPSATAMESAGFVYAPRVDAEDNVRCKKCGQEVYNWSQVSDIAAKHNSSNCAAIIEALGLSNRDIASGANEPTSSPLITKATGFKVNEGALDGLPGDNHAPTAVHGPPYQSDTKVEIGKRDKVAPDSYDACRDAIAGIRGMETESLASAHEGYDSEPITASQKPELLRGPSTQTTAILGRGNQITGSDTALPPKLPLVTAILQPSTIGLHELPKGDDVSDVFDGLLESTSTLFNILESQAAFVSSGDFESLVQKIVASHFQQLEICSSLIFGRELLGLAD